MNNTNFICRIDFVGSNKISLWANVCCFFYVISANILMIVGIWKTNRNKKLKSIHILFILQCSAGLALSCNVLSETIISLSRLAESVSDVMCQDLIFAWSFCNQLISKLEQFILLNIVINRFIAIRKPFYRRTRTIVTRLLFSSVAFVVTYGVFYYISYKSQWHPGYLFLRSLSFFIFMGLIFSALGINLYLITSFKKNSTSCNLSSKRKQKYGITTLLVITIVTLILTSPFLLSQIIDDDKYGLYLLYWFNMGVNSCIYCFRSQQICKYYVQLYRNVKSRLCCFKFHNQDVV